MYWLCISYIATFLDSLISYSRFFCRFNKIFNYIESGYLGINNFYIFFPNGSFLFSSCIFSLAKNYILVVENNGENRYTCFFLYLRGKGSNISQLSIVLTIGVFFNRCSFSG